MCFGNFLFKDNFTQRSGYSKNFLGCILDLAFELERTEALQWMS